ncbi:hypothetical protein J6590_014629 [Homalodisca vitripennis]|nr:hypothetical protein J6590_014629 [Homalodisca vitripennis]
MSTTDALVHLVSGILSAFEGGNHAQITACDLSRAFDCIDHDILLVGSQNCIDKIKQSNSALESSNSVNTFEVSKSLHERRIHLDFLHFDATFEKAISSTGFGRFHFSLLAVCGLIYLDTALEITILSFVLPAAKCDFNMSSSDQGYLTAAPMLGMVLGSYFWGCLADLWGRKLVLIASLLMDGICGMASSISPWYPLFFCFRFLSGFGITGAMGIVFAYLGEFQPTKYREKILSWMELFWTAGVILLPLTAWAIIPLRLRYESTFLRVDSWNVFVAVCSVPSLLLALWLSRFPESPKYLLEVEEYDKSLEVLRCMYSTNTGQPPDNYPIISLKEKKRGLSVVSIQSNRSVKCVKDLKCLLSDVWEMTKILCRPPYRKSTLLTCLIQFGLTSGYYTFMMWFPELFHRFQRFEAQHPGQPTSICQVSSVLLDDQGPCDPTIDTSVYLNTVIIGLSCVPTSFWLPLCVRRLGTKFFLVFCLMVPGVVALGLYFVQNSWQNLVLSCVFEALTSVGISTVYCTLVDLFPTNLRVMAAALSLTFGRSGALFGNLIFGYLIDLNCFVPIVTFSVFLLVVFCVSFCQTLGEKN